jgi:hypothetical protein
LRSLREFVLRQLLRGLRGCRFSTVCRLNAVALGGWSENLEYPHRIWCFAFVQVQYERKHMVKVIETNQLKEAVNADKVAAIYDNRGEGSFSAKRIRGAKWLSVPDAQQGKGLPGDKDAMLVFY